MIFSCCRCLNCHVKIYYNRYNSNLSGNTKIRKINSTKNVVHKIDKNQYISNSYLAALKSIDTEIFTASARASHPFTTIWSDEFRKVLNYPPHPPMPASRHREPVLHTPEDYQSPEHLGIFVNSAWSVFRFPPDCNQSGGCRRYSG